MRWATRGAPGIFIQGHLLQRWQQRPVGLVWRLIVQAAVRSLGVVPVDELCNIRLGGTHAVIGAQVYPLVLDRAPRPLDEYVVAPGATSVHGQAHAARQYGMGELLGGELATLVGVDW